MCRRKMWHGNRLGFRDVKFLCENLCETVDEHGLPCSLLINRCDNFGCEGLFDFICILSKEALAPLQV